MAPVHEGEIRADAALVRRLLREQCPRFAELAITALPREVEGTDHVLFRLGPDLLVRLPKIDWAVDQIPVESVWLPRLAPHVPARLAVPVFVGEPAGDYPWAWSVVAWIEGSTPPRLGVDDVRLAEQVAGFARSLHGAPAMGGPPRPPGSRGTSLRSRLADGHAALAKLAGSDDGFDLAEAAAVWEDCASAPDFTGEPVWIHGDLQPGNLLVQDGVLAGVIDFAPGRADPAPDLAAAWWTFTGRARAAYREAIGHDHDTWRRARGWALLPAFTGIRYYRKTFPRMAEHGRRTVAAVLADAREFG